MTAEDIVQALAASAPSCYYDGLSHTCVFCGAFVPLYPSHHGKDCLWRQAKELLAAEEVMK